MRKECSRPPLATHRRPQNARSLQRGNTHGMPEGDGRQLRWPECVFCDIENKEKKIEGVRWCVQGRYWWSDHGRSLAPVFNDWEAMSCVKCWFSITVLPFASLREKGKCRGEAKIACDFQVLGLRECGHVSLTPGVNCSRHWNIFKPDKG